MTKTADQQAGGPRGTAGPRQLLLLDDEESILIPVAKYFRALGWLVVAAREPEEAEALLELQHFDLVILDLRVGFGTEGLEVLRALRRGGHFMPVIVLSGHVTEEVEAEARRCGADVVLRKPKPLADVAQVALVLTVPRP